MGTMKIAVLGLGPSLPLFLKDLGQYDLTIGVNDIYKSVHTDYVVCLDYPKKFSPERLKIIMDCWPKGFYSQLPNYSGLPNFVKIELQKTYPDKGCDLKIDPLPKSFCSPFVAVAIAVKYLKATEVHIYGVDFIDHPKLKNLEVLKKMKVHFFNLKVSLQQRGCTMEFHGDGFLKDLNAKMA